MHFRSVQGRHEKYRRGDDPFLVDKPNVNGMTGPSSRPGMRRRVTGNEGLPPAGLASASGGGSGTPVSGNVVPSVGSSRGGILSPLNPKRVTSPSGLLGFAAQQQQQQPNASATPRPKSPSPQMHAQSRLRRTLPGLGRNG